MKFCVDYEFEVKTAQKCLFFIFTTAVLYKENIITIHILWRLILGTGKVKSFHKFIEHYAQMVE
jgi:hypothetical protein